MLSNGSASWSILSFSSDDQFLLFIVLTSFKLSTCRIFCPVFLGAKKLLLGIGGNINSDILGVLLGGISVYVLQNSFQSRSNTNPSTDKNV